MAVDIDDVDTSIVYSGSWQALIGSTRQWGGGTVHSTTQNGASATISFRGTRIIMYCTVLMGGGSETVNMNFDGHLGSLTRHSHDTTDYYDNWFDSGPVADGVHTLIVSNGGGASDTPFQLDAFHIEGSGVITSAVTAPPPPPPSQPTPVQVTTTKTATATITTTNASSSSSGSSSSSSSPSSKSSSGSSSSTSGKGTFSTLTTTNSGGDKTVVTVQYITTGADGSVTTRIADSPSSALNSSHPPIGAIVGGVLGGLLLILLLLLLLCLRRRRNAGRHVLLGEDTEKYLNSRPRNPTAVTPFQLHENGMSSRNSGTVISPAYEDGFVSKHGLFSAQPVINPTSPSTASALVAGNSSAHSDYNSGASEKNTDLFSNSSPTDESMYVSDPSSHNTCPPRLPEVDAGPFRPRYLSGDTIIAATTSSIYASAMLAPLDTNDFPPSYHQSSRNNSTSHPYPVTTSLPQ